MVTLKDIEKEVLSLPKNKYSDFRKWFYSYDFENWDQDIAKDSVSGKLDFLIDEALEEKSPGKI
ncbi:MAG: hypothetical protein JXL81_14005 [Deltaproteobacteria bacterium]|nr:hypothetical protein [Deltaproteobacteria bacterium]